MIFGEGPIIKNIAGDLNKLFLQGSRAGQPINVEGSAAADQGTAALMAARDPVIQEISVGMSGEQSARYTVSGTPPLSLPNSLGKPLKAWSVDLLPYQEGTGDPSPDNVRPIHGTDKLTITTAGNNIFDFAQLANLGANPVAVDNGYQFGLVGAQFFTGVPVSYGANLITISVKVKCITATNVSLRLAFSDGTFQNGTGTSATEPTLLTLTSYVNKEVIAIRFNWAQAGRVEVTDFMVNIGTEALPYEPYTATQTVLTLPQTVYTGTIGSEGGESRWGEVDLGTLSYGHRTSNNREIFETTIIGMKTITSSKVPFEGMCEIYRSVSNNAPWGNNDISYGSINSKLVDIVDNRFDNVNDFKAAVSGVKLIYPLATPTTFPLTAPTIPTSTGTATTWATAEDGTVDSMEVTYVGKA